MGSGHTAAHHCWRVLAFAAAFASLLAGCSEHATGPENHNPTINSLAAFPTAIGRTDSVIVICSATDPDGDGIVYDWFTDTRLAIQGRPPDVHFVNSTLQPSRVFYPTQYVRPPVDTVWVECSVRDQRGGVATDFVTIIVHD